LRTRLKVIVLAMSVFVPSYRFVAGNV
jgi:hypothetical protein